VVHPPEEHDVEVAVRIEAQRLGTPLWLRTQHTTADGGTRR
jgi:hypothetical protein